MSARPAQRMVPRRTKPGVFETQLADLEARLNLLQAQVRQAQQLASLGTAASTIAHEVSNLLTPIFSYAQAALKSDDDALMRKALAVTVKNVRILVAMSDHVLEISSAKPATREKVSVRTTVNEAAESLCRDLAKDGIAFTVNVDERVFVLADPLQLRQVFFNLFLNAREVMAPTKSGRLSVSSSMRDGRIVISVRNTGTPIPPELLPKIFEPFQSSKRNELDERQRCTGLGLALCRDLIEENDGDIRAASDATGGTTFTITLAPA